jgi:TusE/DsrC/DsvC family sulfur relay protein
MPTRDYAGVSIQTNEEGFMTDSSQWTQQVGEAIAREVGVWPLSEKHWNVITFCREDAAREGQSPGLRRIAKNSGVDMKALYQLFPRGPGKLAARIAGLPKPKSCV